MTVIKKAEKKTKIKKPSKFRWYFTEQLKQKMSCVNVHSSTNERKKP